MSYVDVLEVIVLVLTRAGFWTTRAWRQAPQRAQGDSDDDDTPTRPVVPEHIVTDSHGWTRVERHAIVQLLDACRELVPLPDKSSEGAVRFREESPRDFA